MQRKSSSLLRKSSYAVVMFFAGCLMFAGCQSLVGCRTKTDVAPATSYAPTPDNPPSPPSPSDQPTFQAQEGPYQLGAPEAKAEDTVQPGTVQLAGGVKTLGSGSGKSSSPTLKLTVSGLQPGAGPLRLAIFRSSSSFPSHESATEKHTVEVTGDVVSTEIATDPNKIAIAAYQDVNNDGKLNKGMFGIPTEPYGFSNNAKGTMGPPSFDSAVLRSTNAAEIKLEKVDL